MRKLILFLGILAAFSSLSFAEKINGVILDDGLSYSKNVDVDLNKDNIIGLSVQVNYSSTSWQSLTFTDGRPSTATLTVTGGAHTMDGAYFSINGITITQDNIAPFSLCTFSTGPSAENTASSISSAIVNCPALQAIVTSTNVAGVIYATATTAGIFSYPVFSSTAGATWSSPIMQNSVNPAVSYLTDTITAANTFYLALPVLLTSSAGTAPSPLAAKTTYYITSPTSTSFKLAYTSTGALAGLAIDISTQTQKGGGTFNLAPIGLLGTFKLALQGSNDGTNFFNVYLATGGVADTLAYSTTYATTTRLWDLGRQYIRYLKFVFTNGTWGAVKVTTIINGQKGE